MTDTIQTSVTGEFAVVSAVDPRPLVGLTDNDALDSIGTEVADRFERVLDEVSQTHAPAESTTED